MSIQRIRLERPKHPSGIYLDVTPDQRGDYVLYTAHAAEVERLTVERDDIEQRLDIAEHDSKKAWSALDLIAWHIHKGQAGDCGHAELPLMVYDLVCELETAQAARDIAVRERDEACEALRGLCDRVVQREGRQIQGMLYDTRNSEGRCIFCGAQGEHTDADSSLPCILGMAEHCRVALAKIEGGRG